MNEYLLMMISLFGLDEGCGAHAGADAHADDAILGVLSLQFGQQSGDLARARAAQGVS